MQRLKKNFLTAATGLTLTTLLVLHAGLVRAGGGEDAPVSSGMPTVLQDKPAPVAAQGMRVYRDPRTGRLGPPPPGCSRPACLPPNCAC